MGKGSGTTRGDRRRNARRERLRAVLPRDGAVVGIDLAEDKQALAVIDHDVRVLARKTVKVKVFRLGEAAIPSKCGHLRIVDSCNFAHLSDYRTPVHLCRPGVAWCAGSGGHRTRRAPGGAGWACPLFLPPWGRRRLSAQGQASRVRVPGSLTVRGCPAVTAGLDVEGRPRTLARRVPRPERGSLVIKGERRRSRLPPALGRAAAGRAHAAALRSAASACSYATGLILPSAECLRW